MKKTLEERFWEKVNKTETCWFWTGAPNKKGYGLFYNPNGDQLAHRLSWVLHNGEIPNGLKVLHKCDTPPCVNPDHLFLGTIADNNRDKNEKGRSANSAKTECKRGHSNWRFRSNGSRVCVTCEQSRKKRRRENYRQFIEGGGKWSDWHG